MRISAEGCGAKPRVQNVDPHPNVAGGGAIGWTVKYTCNDGYSVDGGEEKAFNITCTAGTAGTSPSWDTVSTCVGTSYMQATSGQSVDVYTSRTMLFYLKYHWQCFSNY